MRIASFESNGTELYGRVDGADLVVPHRAFLQRYPSLAALLGGDGCKALESAGESARVSLADAKFMPLIPRPGKLICVGINYRPHMQEMGREPPEYPWLFTRFADSQVGHGQPLVAPRNTGDYDFEGELAFVIGREAHHVSADSALDYVAGYTCFMDGSLRDFQRHGTQFTPGKNFWHSGSFGPWLVTADEIPDPAVLNLETRLNGKVMQRASVSDLHFDIAVLIEYISSFCKLHPGDVISTGTPGGVGFARKPPVWMRPGDVIEVEIDGIGTLRNPVVAES